MLVPRPIRNLAKATAKAMIRSKLRAKGYNRTQARAALTKFGDTPIMDKLAEFWAKYGPTILAILQAVMALLPVIISLFGEAPAGPPITDEAQLEAVYVEEAGDEGSATLATTAGPSPGPGSSDDSTSGYGIYYVVEDGDFQDSCFVGPFVQSERAEDVAGSLAIKPGVRSVVIAKIDASAVADALSEIGLAKVV